MKRTPLYEKIINANGKMTEFAGWEMPIQFSSVIEEHNSVRKSVGCFDISHMGIFLIKGENAKDKIQKLFPTDLYSFGPNQSCYTAMLNEKGGIIDDLIIYDLGENNNNEKELILIVNASRSEYDLNWIKSNINSKEINIKECDPRSVLIAIQGKQSFRIFEQWARIDISKLPPKGCQRFNFLDPINNNQTPVFIGKTGYTGETGLEIMLPSFLAEKLWEYLIDSGVKLCGLGSRDTLRLEAGLPLYGNELTKDTSPFEAGIGWIVNLESPHMFIGKEALEKQVIEGIHKKLVGICLNEKRIARKGFKIFSHSKEIGYITSGSWSPSLEKPIALGYVGIEYSDLNTNIDIDIRGRLYKGIVTKRPFYSIKS